MGTEIHQTVIYSICGQLHIWIFFIQAHTYSKVLSGGPYHVLVFELTASSGQYGKTLSHTVYLIYYIIYYIYVILDGNIDTYSNKNTII